MSRVPPQSTSPSVLAIATVASYRATAVVSITGERNAPRSSGLVRGIASARAASRAQNSSTSELSTNALDAAEHFCPPSPNAERAVPSTARSRSALAATTTGFFPPISQIAGRGQAVENERWIAIPTSLDPVNVSPPIRASATRAAPVVSPGPVTRLTTPAGTPASISTS